MQVERTCDSYVKRQPTPRRNRITSLPGQRPGKLYCPGLNSARPGLRSECQIPHEPNENQIVIQGHGINELVKVFVDMSSSITVISNGLVQYLKSLIYPPQHLQNSTAIQRSYHISWHYSHSTHTRYQPHSTRKKLKACPT